MTSTWPTHYRDDPSRGLCPKSNQPRGQNERSCPYGCAGALEHYANDGHPECAGDRTTCRSCGQAIEHEPNAGWVTAESGDTGGTYDWCPDSEDHRHQP